jgi:formylglycine-generating enzyme required for sulfatase activity
MSRPSSPDQPGRTDAAPSHAAPASTDAYQAGSAPAGRLRLEPGVEPVPGFTLVQPLGRGGFGEVWKAKGPGGFPVALKFIPLGGQAGAAEMRSVELMKEARHAHLLVQFGAWERDGVLVVAMELADRTLADRLSEAMRQGLPGIPRAEALEYLSDAARGIDHLNGLGIQHRDVKPKNLLLVGGVVKVADFGLAKLLEKAGGSNTGALTFAYAAPEFFDGRVSPSSDQYSLAVSYCELRGGRLPFTGDRARVMAGHVAQPPDLTMLPGAERPAVAKALAKKPEERWPSCRAFAEAVAAAGPDAVLGASTPAAAPTETRRNGPLRWVWPAALAGVLLLLTVALVVAFIWSRTRETVAPGKEFTNALGMKLVRIPAGTFTMGSPDKEDGRLANERPLHEVTIPEPFFLGACPVTKGQFAAFVTDAGYLTEAEEDGRGGWGYNAATRKYEGLDPQYTWRNTGWEQTDEHPVVNVTWDDARKFCAWLSKKEGKAYELPTEAEWEYACRAGTSTRFWCGDKDDDLRGNANLADATFKENYPDAAWAVSWDDGYPFTSPVGAFKPNPWGLYDMQGNVWQWTADRYGQYENTSFKDPKGPDSGELRVLRGGSWGDGPRSCRSAHRLGNGSGYRYDFVGFRVVLRPAARTP